MLPVLFLLAALRQMIHKRLGRVMAFLRLEINSIISMGVLLGPADGLNLKSPTPWSTAQVRYLTRSVKHTPQQISHGRDMVSEAWWTPRESSSTTMVVCLKVEG